MQETIVCLLICIFMSVPESDDNLSFGDLAVSDESQAHEEPDDDIDQALFDLKVEVIYI